MPICLNMARRKTEYLMARSMHSVRRSSSDNSYQRTSGWSMYCRLHVGVLIIRLSKLTTESLKNHRTRKIVLCVNLHNVSLKIILLGTELFNKTSQKSFQASRSKYSFLNVQIKLHFHSQSVFIHQKQPYNKTRGFRG